MEIVIAAAVLAAGLVVAALLLVKRAPGLAAAGTAPSTTRRASGAGQGVPGRQGRDGRRAGAAAGDRTLGGAAGSA